VKSVAVSADWLGNILQGYDKLDTDTKTEYENVGVAFDQRLVLMLVQPLRYSNLKSSDINNVSFVCVGMFLFREMSCL
jgi:hypothetical protein